MNILVYAGRGVSSESLHHTLRSLRMYIGGFYDVKPITAEILCKDPWEINCSLLVIPGGRDIPYVEDLPDIVCDRIRRFVSEGGKYLGICAGAYFSCRQVEFEPGTKLEVIGRRSLNLCHATAKGSITANFSYGSEESAQLVELTRKDGNFDGPGSCQIYCNGGCWFEGELNNQNTSNWSTGYVYKDQERPAILLGNIGKGRAILSGVHPEYDMNEYWTRHPRAPRLKSFEEKETGQLDLWKKILLWLGLNLEMEGNPSLLKPTPLLFFTIDKQMQQKFIALFGKEGKCPCEETILHFIQNYHDGFDQISDVDYPVAIIDPDIMAKERMELSFSPKQFLSFLTEQTQTSKMAGHTLLYAEYIPSTQTILTRNPKLASSLPDGSIILAGDQLAGKGRGSNTWLSSKGCLQFTMVLRHRDSHSLPLIQYLVGLSMLEAIVNEPGYGWLKGRLHLKWPNDLYSSVSSTSTSASASASASTLPLSPTDGEKPKIEKEWTDLKKLGGILVNSQTLYNGNGDNNEFLLLIGFGFNIFDTPWTRSLNEIIEQHNIETNSSLPGFTKEKLLARYCNTFEKLYYQLQTSGFPFDLYYRHWLHSNQAVYLENEQMPVRIEGIDPQGYLIVRPHADGLLGLLNKVVPEPGSPASIPFLLQPDGNSFDMMKNLIKRKI